MRSRAALPGGHSKTHKTQRRILYFPPKCYYLTVLCWQAGRGRGRVLDRTSGLGHVGRVLGTGRVGDLKRLSHRPRLGVLDPTASPSPGGNGRGGPHPGRQPWRTRGPLTLGVHPGKGTAPSRALWEAPFRNLCVRSHWVSSLLKSCSTLWGHPVIAGSSGADHTGLPPFCHNCSLF